MEQECKYDPARDIMPVDQFGFVDLVKANANNAIDEPLEIIESRFNDIDDPKAVGLRPCDVFEEMQANRVILHYKPKDSASKEDVVSA